MKMEYIGNKRRTYSQNFICKTHGYACTKQGIENHVAAMEELNGEGRAGCEIIISYVSDQRRGSDKGKQIEWRPALIGRLIKAGIIHKDTCIIIDPKKFKEAIADQQELRRLGIIAKDNNCGSMIGESWMCPAKECHGRHETKDYDGSEYEPYVSFGLAKKMGIAEKMMEGWVKGMIELGHIPSDEQKKKFFKKALARQG